MTRIVVDELLRNKLHDLTQPLELCDSDGRVLGRYVPDPTLYEGVEPRLSREERQNRKQEKSKTYTTAEVLAHLKKL